MFLLFMLQCLPENPIFGNHFAGISKRKLFTLHSIMESMKYLFILKFHDPSHPSIFAREHDFCDPMNYSVKRMLVVSSLFFVLFH